ncbi:AAA family ATPase [Patescibacteria group bacterium]|uniref:Putative DNA polymerase n=1 Tax=viral metagenome TaxID=1070528 RepID=A0A6M3MAF9_9ZZZZ|nr:AAA family ATPase [Patescibacteria group bacterium]MBU0847512.1 AAA family ATPase [Patescibacteria group bacterium]
MVQPLHLKYRPSNFDEFVGNKGVISSIKSVLERKDGIPHSFLFTGPSGCGKTTLARITKEHLNCSDMDFQELNVANVRGIDTIREIGQSCGYSPHEGPIKIFLLDEAQKLTSDAQNALLKLLEDTPNHVYFILCTTDPEKLIKTIKTRCHTYQVQSLLDRDIKELLNKVLKKEEVKGFPEKAIDEICKASLGSPRQALVILDSVIDIADDDELIASVINYSIDEKSVIDLCKALLEKQKWSVVSKVLKGINDEPEKVRYAVLGYMDSVLLNDGNPLAAVIIELFWESFMYVGKAGLTHCCYTCPR